MNQIENDGIFRVMDIISDFYAHGIDDHFLVLALLVVIIADIILGVSRAWAYHSFSSSKFRKGLVGHVSMVIIVAMIYPFVVHMGLSAAIDTFIVAMLAAYGSSILANLSALGVEIPYIDQFVKRNIDKDKFVLKNDKED